mmetsp:Transcript_8612/g.19219  ORF Transcript_8612/g.19219 Transcript_8612/m.19219 type:complete len:132 (-) Transcript_8612:324-719(-)
MPHGRAGCGVRAEAGDWDAEGCASGAEGGDKGAPSSKFQERTDSGAPSGVARQSSGLDGSACTRLPVAGGVIRGVPPGTKVDVAAAASGATNREEEAPGTWSGVPKPEDPGLHKPPTATIGVSAPEFPYWE